MLLKNIFTSTYKFLIVVGLSLFGACNQSPDGGNSSGDIERVDEETAHTNLEDDGLGEGIEVGLLELAASRTDLQSFTTAAALINLQETLDEADGQFTIFAPTDDAFAQANLTITREDTANNEELRNILLQHIVSYHTTSEYWYEEILLPTLNGGRIVIHLKNDIPHVNEAKFITVDIAGKGGVLHVIDKVLEPYPESAENQVQ